MPEHFNPDMKDIVTTDFKKKFFGSVLYEKREDGAFFLDIIEMLDNEYLITRMDISSETVLEDSIFIIIKGVLIDEKGEASDREERIMTLIFSN